MEKKGEIFNQLAIISDLLEGVNLESEATSVLFMLKEEEFNKIFDKISKKDNRKKSDEQEITFSVRIGKIEFVFTISKSNA
jgi:hypothetical protein